ncbi:MAG: zinc ribbon domain-containing protein, partial [Intestinibacter sp.]|uniref:zinc ribbon domain-containing protein n=1 Tax=Intestinibacter sp. TaxID=1965304 RepID=UPI003F13E5D6
MKCSKCGNEVKGDAKFCNVCGQKLDTQNNIENEQNSQSQVDLNKDEGNKKESIIKEGQVSPPKKKNRTLIAVIGVVAVVLVAVFIASMGSSETEKVSTVKDGYFYDYTEEEGYTDVGTAFDNYFADGTWEAFTADDDSE